MLYFISIDFSNLSSQKALIPKTWELPLRKQGWMTVSADDKGEFLVIFFQERVFLHYKAMPVPVSPLQKQGCKGLARSGPALQTE